MYEQFLVVQVNEKLNPYGYLHVVDNAMEVNKL